MQKLFLALAFVVGSMGYVVVQRGLDEQGHRTPALVATQPSTEATPAGNTTPTAQAAAPTAVTTQPKPKKGLYTDGTFTGASASQPYGIVQVAVVVSGGRITQVKLLQTPNQGGQTREINSYALPLLVQETISAQSGNIDAVSGASLTSPAFIESLASALTKARA